MSTAPRFLTYERGPNSRKTPLDITSCLWHERATRPQDNIPLGGSAFRPIYWRSIYGRAQPGATLLFDTKIVALG